MAQEGQTATNPNTGERVIFQGGAWQPLGGASTPQPTRQGPLPVFRSPLSPEQQAAEGRAQQDQALQIETFNRGARGEARADEAARRARLEWEATHNPDGTPKQNVSNATEAQSKAGTLLTRIAGGFNDIQNVISRAPEAQEPGFIESVRGGLDPNGLTAPAARWWAGADRRMVADSQRDVLDALLTLGTGAAYNKEQLDGQLASYFPALNDTQEEIAVKNNRLKRLIAAARVQAGPLADKLDAAVAPYMQQIEQENLVKTSSDGSPADRNTLVSAVRRPDGQFDLTWGDGRKQIADSIPFSSGVTADIAPPPSDEERNSALGSVDAIVRGAADTLTLGFADEIAAAGNTIFGGGTYEQNLARERGIDSQDERVNPYLRLGGQIAGGFGLPTGWATGARGLARIGALYGAGYGAGSADGSAKDRLIGAAQGGVVGGATGGVLGALGSRLASRGGGGGSGGGGASDLMQAAQRQGVDVLPADVGGPMTRRFTAGVAQSPFGGGQITRAAQARDAQFAERIGQIAAQEGAPVRQEVLGDTARTAAERYIANTAAEGRRLYEGARELSQGVQITPTNALSSIDNQLAELAPTASTDAPVIGALNTLREDLARGEAISVDAIRRLRTSTRAQAQSEGLRGSDYQRRAGEVLNSLSEDIASQLPPEAAQAFRQADQAWAARLDTIDNTMNAILGPRNDRSAEMVANRLGQMARGDSARLRTFVDSLNPEEAGIVRGSLISDLGRATSGQQSAAGTEFSLNTFLTNWDKLPERTRNILFRGESRAAIEDLARIAEGARGTSRHFNTSHTAGAGSVLSALGSIGTMGASAVAENLTGRLLASPRFARWLARPPRDPARAIRRLEQIAVRDPSIQPDISRIVQALEAGPNRAAAQEEQ